MAESNTKRVVVLDDYLPLDGIDIIDLNPTLGLFPPTGREDAVYQALRGAHPRLKVFRKAESPVHWHYRDHPRDTAYRRCRGRRVAGTAAGQRWQHWWPGASTDRSACTDTTRKP